MSDNAYGTTFGPSAVGAINLVSGQTNGVVATNNAQTFSYYPTGDGPAGASGSGTFTGAGYISADGNGGATVVGDPQPLGDVCVTRGAVQLGGKNIGDLLNAQNVSWGWFQGGFDLTVTNDNGTTGCARTTLSTVTGVSENDYVVHHSAFQFYASTSNPTHARPSSVSAIGNSYAANGTTLDPANHNYDIHDFFDAVTAGNFPAVNFLKAPGYQDGHAGYSDPLDEQVFVTTVINFLQKQPDWASTVVVIAYDDSDGWYDHQASPVVNASLLNESVTTAGAAGSPDLLASLTLTNGTAITSNLGDWLNGEGSCTTGATGTATTAQLTDGLNGTTAVQGRCGHGPRLPFLVISPFAKVNYVDHTLIDQSSILRFVEDNWLGSQRIAGSFDALAGVITNMLDFTAGANAGPTPVTLDPTTGLPASACTTCS
jgi:phospholipase C